VVCSGSMRALPLMLLEAGINVLKHAGYSGTSHVAICFPLEIVCDAGSYLGGQACLGGGLE
jgi:hypothetical protein